MSGTHFSKIQGDYQLYSGLFKGSEVSWIAQKNTTERCPLWISTGQDDPPWVKIQDFLNVNISSFPTLLTEGTKAKIDLIPFRFSLYDEYGGERGDVSVKTIWKAVRSILPELPEDPYTGFYISYDFAEKVFPCLIPDFSTICRSKSLESKIDAWKGSSNLILKISSTVINIVYQLGYAIGFTLYEGPIRFSATILAVSALVLYSAINPEWSSYYLFCLTQNCLNLTQVPTPFLYERCF